MQDRGTGGQLQAQGQGLLVISRAASSQGWDLSSPAVTEAPDPVCPGDGGLAGHFSAPSECSFWLRAAGVLRRLPCSRSSAAHTRGVP